MRCPVSMVVAVTGSAILLAGVSSPACAQEGDVQPTGIELVPIIIEGEKVTRTLRDTTTSVGVVTGEEIEDRQIQDVQEAINATPNALAAEGSRGNSGFVIRGLNSEGLTQNQHPLAASLVSVVIDGATQNPEATRRGARSLWDVEQVEILRGPQSTLQARNSLAGSIIVRTNDPVYNYESLVEGTYGSQGLWGLGFVVNAPITTNQFAVRVAGQLIEGERDISYTDPSNNRLDDDRLANLRGKVLIEPDSVPGLSVLLTVARTEDRPAVTVVTGPDFFERVFALPTSSVDFRETDANNYVSDVSYRLAPGYRLRSVTAFADTTTDIGTAAGSPLQRDDERIGGDLTQDLRLEIEANGNGLSGVLGLFYGRFTTDLDSDITFDAGFPIGVLPIQVLTAAYGTRSAAAYADLRYRFLDRFQLIAGGRILHDTVESRAVGQSLDLATFTPVPIDETTKAEFTEVLPKAGIAYDLAPNQTVGFTYSQGYRAGFTQIRLNGEVNTIEPEQLDAYEISYRSQWLDGRLDLNGNVFYYDYANQQVAVEDPNFPGAVIIINGGKSHAYGAEIEARWRPSQPWQLFAGLGLLRTRFDSLETPDGDFSGNEFPEAPAVTATVGGLYRDPSGWFAGANVRYVDDYFSFADLENTALQRVDAHTLVDASVGYERDKTKLTLFVKNLFDEQYVTSISPGATEATVGDGRLVGVTLTQRF